MEKVKEFTSGDEVEEGAPEVGLMMETTKPVTTKEESSNSAQHKTLAGDNVQRRFYNPVDKGRSWIILICVILINMTVMGFLRSFGILFLPIQRHFDAAASAVSVIPGLQAIFFSSSAMLTMTVLVEVMTKRNVIRLGGLLCMVGISSCFFVRSLFLLYPLLGASCGVSLSLLFGPGPILLGQYFKRRRAIAMALSNTGSSMGVLILPIIIRTMVENYGLSGAFLLIGGMLGNTVVLAGFLTPPADYKLKPGVKRGHLLGHGQDDDAEDDFFSSRSQNSGHTNTGKVYYKNEKYGDQVFGVNGGKNLNSSTTNNESEINGDCRDSRDESVPLTLKVEARIETDECLSEDGENSESKGKDPPSLSSGRGSNDLSNDETPVTNVGGVTEVALLPDSDIASGLNQQDEDQGKKVGERTVQRGGRSQNACIKWLRSCCDVSLLRSPMLWLLLGYLSFGVIGMGMPIAFLPPLAAEQGLSSSQAGFLLTVIGALDICGQLTTGIVVQMKWLRPQTMIIGANFMLGTALQLARICKSVAALNGLAAVCGACSGVPLSMLQLVIIDFVGLERFPKAFGVVQLTLGLVSACMHPFLGYLRDVTGSYITTFHVIGGCSYTSACLLLLEPLARRLDKRLSAATSS